MDKNRMVTGIRLMIATLLVLLTVISGPGNAEAAKKMPDFSKKNVVDGTMVSSEAYRGKVLLINFWATWCPPCRKEIPTLIKLQEKYQKKGFSVIGISMDESGKRVVKKFLDRFPVNYPMIMGNAKLGRGFGGVIGIPVSFVVDREGNLVKRLDGYVSEKVLEKELLKVFE